MPASKSALALGNDCDAADRHVAARKIVFDCRLHVFLDDIHFHRLHEFAIGQLWQAFGLSTDACKFFNIGIPGCNILVANRPVDAVPVFLVRFEIEIAPAITLAAPQQGTAAQDVAAYPVERFFLVLHIRVETIVVPELAVVLVEPTEFALDGIVFFVQLPVALGAERVVP